MNIFYRLILIGLLVVGLALPHTSAYAFVCTGPKGDGVTDDTAAFNQCLKTAANGSDKTVTFPSGTYRLTSFVTIPAGVSIIGETGATIAGTLRLLSYSKVINFNFTSGGRRIVIGQPPSPYITGAEVRNCTFGHSSWASIMIYQGNDCIIDNNTLLGSTSSVKAERGQNIQLLGGKRNRITNNYVVGGKTGIIVKYSRDNNGGGYNSIIENTVIKGNTVEKFFDEGISFDTINDSGIACSTLERDFVKSASSNTVTLTHPNWNNSGNPSFIGYDMIFMDGALAGRYRRITGQSNGLFTLDQTVPGVAQGDEIIIGAPYKNNLIANNTVKAGNPGSILLYGLSFGNIIENNVVTLGNIEIRSTDNQDPTLPTSVCGARGRSPCGYNIIRNNTVGGRISVFYRNPANVSGVPNPYSPYTSYGNKVVDNITSSVYARYQVMYVKGNSGSTDFQYVTLQNETSLAPPKISLE